MHTYILMATMVLMTVRGANGPPSVADAAAQLGVGVSDIDATFGVVAIDPGRGLYSVQVPSDRLPAGIENETPYSGPFSNPKIAPFGPLE